MNTKNNQLENVIEKKKHGIYNSSIHYKILGNNINKLCLEDIWWKLCNVTEGLKRRPKSMERHTMSLNRKNQHYKYANCPQISLNFNATLTLQFTK